MSQSKLNPNSISHTIRLLSIHFLVVQLNQELLVQVDATALTKAIHVAHPLRSTGSPGPAGDQVWQLNKVPKLFWYLVDVVLAQLNKTQGQWKEISSEVLFCLSELYYNPVISLLDPSSTPIEQEGHEEGVLASLGEVVWNKPSLMSNLLCKCYVRAVQGLQGFCSETITCITA